MVEKNTCEMTLISLLRMHSQSHSFGIKDFWLLYRLVIHASSRKGKCHSSLKSLALWRVVLAKYVLLYAKILIMRKELYHSAYDLYILFLLECGSTYLRKI